MNTRVPFYVLVVLVSSLVLTSGAVHSQSQDPQIPNEPQRNVLTYQGRLIRGGIAVNGTCNFIFSLWNANNDNTRVGNPLPMNDVLIDHGLFSVNLDFGASIFDGQKRWLQTEVRCPGDDDFTTLGRQAVTSAPYASYSLEANHALNSDMLDGHHASDFLLPNHPISGTLSVSAAAFSPADNSCDFHNSGTEIFAGLSNPCGEFHAGLQIPDGVTITKLIFYWLDGSNSDGIAFLRATTLNITQPLELANVYTNGNGNVASSSSTTTSILVDNSQYSYFLSLNIAQNIHVYGVQIEYEYTSP